MSNKKQLNRLCEEQEYLCFWCFRKCTREHPDGKTGHEYNHWPTQATVDHMFHKFDPIRKTIWGRFIVMACYRCNARRNKEQQKDVNIRQIQREIYRAHVASLGLAKVTLEKPIQPCENVMT